MGEVRKWRAFEHGGEHFDLSHLDAMTVEYANPNAGPAAYKFDVTFAFHCFTTSDPDENSLGDYQAPKECRPFCRKRYELSKCLPDLVSSLANDGMYCFFAGFGRFATIELTLDNGETVHYRMVFTVFREKKKLRLHIESAYPLKERPGKLKKIKFLVIAYNTLMSKEIKGPK